MTTTTNTLAPRAGDMVGRRWAGYEVARLVGEGGQGAVYMATNPRLPGKRIAIKVLLPEVSSNAEAVERFFAEARAAAAIDDPNIVDILDAGAFDDGRHYIAMPFLEGCSLEQYCEERGPLGLDLAMPILWQIGSALHVAHVKAIIHRDLKGQNVFLTARWGRRNFVVLLDFGVAKLMDPSLGGVRTRSGLVMGSPHYMAPEQARGSARVDPRADIYSLGVLAYRVLTGRRPYLDDSFGEVIAKQARGEPFPRPRELRPDVPREIDRAIMDALEVDPDRRTRSAKEFTLQLAQAIPNGEALAQMLCPRLFDGATTLPSEQTMRPEMVSPTPWTGAISLRAAAPRRQSGARIAAAAVVGMVAGGASIYAVARGGSTSNADTRQTAAAGVAPSGANVRATSGPIDAAAPATIASAPVDATPTPPANAPPAPAIASIAETVDAGAPAATAAHAPPHVIKPAGMGTLVVKAHPWAEVWIDGHSAGTTPVREKVAVGRHSLRLVNDTANKNETVMVSVEKDKDTEVDRKW